MTDKERFLKNSEIYKEEVLKNLRVVSEDYSGCSNFVTKLRDETKSGIYLCHVDSGTCMVDGEVVAVVPELDDYFGLAIISYEGSAVKYRKCSGLYEYVDSSLKETLETFARVYTSGGIEVQFSNRIFLPLEFRGYILEHIGEHYGRRMCRGSVHTVIKKCPVVISIDDFHTERTIAMTDDSANIEDFSDKEKVDAAVNGSRFHRLIDKWKREYKLINVYCEVEKGVCTVNGESFLFIPELVDFTGRAAVTLYTDADEYEFAVCLGKYIDVKRTGLVHNEIYTEEGLVQSKLLVTYPFIPEVIASHNCDCNYISSRFIKKSIDESYFDDLYKEKMNDVHLADRLYLGYVEEEDKGIFSNALQELLARCEKEGKTVGIYCDVASGVCTEEEELLCFIPELLHYTGKAFVVPKTSTGESQWAGCEDGFEKVGLLDEISKEVYCELGKVSSELFTSYPRIPDVVRHLDCDCYYVNSKYLTTSIDEPNTTWIY